MDNQTNPEWLIELTPESLGTGIFLMPDVFSERFGDMIAPAVPNITYGNCIQRGMFAVAFKWVPERISTYEALLKSPKCYGPCVDTCKQPGCICNKITGQCVRLTSRRPFDEYS